MQVHQSGADVASSFAGLAASFAGEPDTGALLHMVCQECVRLVGADCATLAYAEEPGPETIIVASSDDRGRALAADAGGTVDGPWAECMRAGELIRVPDLSADQARWPAFARSALRLGMTSVTVLPVGQSVVTAGALALLGGAVPDSAGLQIARSLADTAGAVIAIGRELRRQQTAISQLQSALTSRIVIEQAKGVLAERWGLAPDEAFDLLRKHARSGQLRLSEVARAIVDGTADIAGPDAMGPR